MTRTITCLHCGKKVPPNPRIKNKQKYCSDKECQKIRMLKWKQREYKKNQAYRKKCKERQKQWRKNYPSDRYMKEYRGKYPMYLNRNRELQRKRNKKRKKEAASMIVKTNALIMQPRDDGAYMLSKVKKNMIVNSNALTLQPSVHGVYMVFNVKKKKIVNSNALLPQSLSP